jgi:hypothetical protein
MNERKGKAEKDAHAKGRRVSALVGIFTSESSGDPARLASTWQAIFPFRALR